MRRLYVPKRSDEQIKYTVDGEIIVAEYKGKTDKFDLSALREGDKLLSVETALEVNPLVDAWRDGGEINVKLLYHHGKDASKEERFPEWEEI